ncbi:MAG: CPBP family glutamic-type intramembrane protease [Myxococcales bacterium]
MSDVQVGRRPTSAGPSDAVAPPARAAQVRLAVVIGLASAASAVLVFPYVLQLTPRLGQHARAPLWVLALAQGAQSGLLAFVLGWIGLVLGASVGLDAPILRAWVYRRPRREAEVRLLPRSASLGLATGIGLAAMDWLVFWPRLSAGFRAQALGPSLWSGALASFYGGIAEEVLTRLFLTTLAVWMLFKVFRRLDAWVFVAGIAVGALAFAAGHLPTAAMIAPLTALVVTRTLVLNAAGGIVFGGLYWRRGLEQAMIAHFCCDLVLHVVAPALALAR